MDDVSAQKLKEIEVKLDAILVSVEKTRRHFQVTMWVTVIFLVAPLIASVFVIPFFLNSYLDSFESADPSSVDYSTQSQFDLLKGLLQ